MRSVIEENVKRNQVSVVNVSVVAVSKRVSDRPPNLAPRQLALGPLSSRPAQVTFTEENNRLDLRSLILFG